MISKRLVLVGKRRLELEYCLDKRLSINFEWDFEIPIRDLDDFITSADAAMGPTITANAVNIAIVLRIMYAFTET
jgi:hypothetical protein